MIGFKAVTAIIAVCAARFGIADGNLQFADVGNLPLQSGKVLNDCKVGYRTFGKLDGAKDNAILFPTWYLGHSSDLAGSIGPGKLIDSSKYYVIAVDALTNGVSTSPSNSTSQGDANFPKVTIKDIVRSQHRMLLQLGIHHLKAVMGISMGGIQTFTWVTTYPSFMDKAIPIVGSPRCSSYDLMFYNAGLQTLSHGEADPSEKTAFVSAFASFFDLALTSPSYIVGHFTRAQADGALTGFIKSLNQWDIYDVSSGLDALITNDAFSGYADDESKAAAAVKAKMLIINSAQDHCVNPTPALHFAKLIGAKTIVLQSDAGHSAPWGALDQLSKAIAKFLRS